MTFQPEDLMLRLSDPTGPHRKFALEAAYLNQDAIDLYETDIDFPAVLADMMSVGLMPLDVRCREVIAIVSLTLAAQKRIAEGRVTPPNFADEAPKTAGIPDAFKSALDDVDTAGI